MIMLEIRKEETNKSLKEIYENTTSGQKRGPERNRINKENSN